MRNLGRTVPEYPQNAGSAYYYWPGRTTAGVTITEDRALSLSVFNSCVRVVSEDIAKLRWEVLAWRRQGVGIDRSAEKVRVPDHSVEQILSSSPNRDMTAFSLRQTLVADMLIFGNAYAEVERDLAGRAIALHYIHPERVDPMRDHETHRLFYRVRNCQFGQVDLQTEDMFHVPGFCRIAGIGMPALSLYGRDGRRGHWHARPHLGLLGQQCYAKWHPDDRHPFEGVDLEPSESGLGKDP